MKSTMKFMVAALAVLALLAVPAMARTPDLATLVAGDVAFVYETNLNIPAGVAGAVAVAKFGNDCPDPTGATCTFTGQLAQIPLNADGTLSINTAPPYFGTWFPINAVGAGLSAVNFQIQHADVTLDAMLNATRIDSIATKSVTRDTKITFKLISTYAGNYYKTADGTYAAKVNIELTTPGGGKIQVFGNNAVDLRAITLNGSVEYTDSLPSGSQAATIIPAAIDLAGVEAGTYTATAKWTTTMPWYQLEANSNAVTFTVLSKPITITTNKESVVRGNTFVVTVTGESKKFYWVYLKDASISTTSIYPQISAGQSNVNTPPPAGAGSPLGVNLSMATDVNPAFSKTVNNVTAANITTAADGTRTIQFETKATTYDTKYTVKVIDPADLSRGALPIPG
jgi:hypothetical protein